MANRSNCYITYCNHSSPLQPIKNLLLQQKTRLHVLKFTLLFSLLHSKQKHSVFGWVVFRERSLNQGKATIGMPSTKNYCASGRWMKQAFAEDIDSIVLDFRDRLKVKKDTTGAASFNSTEQQLEDCVEQRSAKLVPLNETHPTLRTFICPTADPLRTSDSYDILMELLDRGNLIKEAVRRLKANRRGKQLKRLEPTTDEFDDRTF